MTIHNRAWFVTSKLLKQQKVSKFSNNLNWVSDILSDISIISFHDLTSLKPISGSYIEFQKKQQSFRRYSILQAKKMKIRVLVVLWENQIYYWQNVKFLLLFFFFFLHLLNGIQAQGKKKVSSLKISSSKAYKIH